MSPVYTLIRKSVKNINLRVKRDGSVLVSAPLHVKTSEIDAFVHSKRQWIENTQRRFMQVPNPATVLRAKAATNEMCDALFLPIVERTLGMLGERRPVTLRYRTCRSRYGSCQIQKRDIMLNRLLYFAPQRLIEYVVLHECIHLRIPNHGRLFHQQMNRWMPDYLLRRRELRKLCAQT
jgi:hypothetical protein